METREMLIVAMAQTKGGSGKSTLAQSIAVAAELEGKRVLLADLDPAQSAAKWWRRRGGPANPMIEAGVKESMAAVTSATGYDVAILDTPGEMLGVIRAAIGIADVIVVPMAPSIKDWEAMAAVESIIKSASKTSNCVWVVNRFRITTDASTEAHSALHKRTGVLPITVSLATDHEKADAQGKSGAELSKRIKGEIDVLWEQIKQVGKRHGKTRNVSAA
jgi:chromosome partitioning protein